MARAFARFVVVIVVIGSTDAAWCQNGELTPAPDEDELSRKREEVADLYAAYYRVTQTDAGHRRLATELLSQAILERADPDLRFAMLTECYEHAAIAGEGELALNAIRDLRRTHDVRVARLLVRVLEVMNDRTESDGIDRTMGRWRVQR